MVVSPAVAGLIARVQLTGIYYVDALLYLALAAGLVFGPQTEPAGAKPA